MSFKRDFDEEFTSIRSRVDAICSTAVTYEVDGVTPRLADINSYSEYVLGTMGKMVGFPAPFIRQVHMTNPQLAQDIITDRISNHFARGKDNFFVREFGDKICGAVSNRYAYFDDDQVMDIIGGSELAKLPYTNAIVTPERLHMRAIDLDHPFHIGDDDSELYFAFFVDNSMVGAAAFKGQLGIFRLACTNGLIVPVRECVICKQVHRGSKDIAAEFSESIDFLKQKKDAVMDILTDAATKRSAVEDMLAELRADYIAKKLNTSKTETAKIMQLYEGTYGGGTKGGRKKGITEFARDLKDINRREFIERRALAVA